MEISVLPSTNIPSSTLLVNNSIPDEISTLSAESATKSGTVKTIVDLDTGTEVVVMAAVVAGMGVGTGVMENVATTTITCDEKKTSNSGATVNIPTMTAKTTWTTDPPPAAVMLNGKCSSLVEVRRTECTSAVTGSVAASVSSSEKDFHVVKIQISPTVNNHSKKFESTEQCAKNSKVLITPSDDSSKQSKISVVSFGPSANTSDSTQFLWTVNNNNNSNINNSSINSDCQSLVTSEKSETICQISPNPENSVQLPKSIVISSSPTTSISPVPVAVNSGKTTTLITGEMVQKPSGDLEVSNPTYLYYMMTSGQCSPSDTLDSGTCSDMENGNLNQSNGARTTPPPLPKKTAPKLKMHLKSTKIIATSQDNDQNNHHNHQKNGTNGNTNGNKHNHHHNRTGSFTDSETSESSLSCDSLNSSEFARSSSLFLKSQSGSPHSPVLTTIAAIAKNGDDRKITKMSFLPDSLLRDIRDRSKLSIGKEVSSNANCTTSAIVASVGDTKRPPQNGFRAKIHVKTSDSLPNAKELRERNTTCVLITQEKDNRSPRTFENDKFYTFHIKERDEENEEECLDVVDSPRMVFKDDDAFAGYKDIHSNTSTIRSSKGTVRGVKNRVRNGIATFLQMQQSNAKNYKEKDSGKVVLYTTSMGIVRETYAKCSNVKQILRTLLVKFEERDVFMSNEYQQEIKERMQSDEIQVPQLFVEAQHIGDAEAVERLNESGELRKMLKPYKSMNSSLTCQTCGGYRLLPCPSCNGSKKSVHRNHFTAEFVALKCMNCDEVGLVKCHNC